MFVKTQHRVFIGRVNCTQIPNICVRYKMFFKAIASLMAEHTQSVEPAEGLVADLKEDSKNVMKNYNNKKYTKKAVKMALKN